LKLVFPEDPDAFGNDVVALGAWLMYLRQMGIDLKLRSAVPHDKRFVERWFALFDKMSEDALLNKINPGDTYELPTFAELEEEGEKIQ
jgi:hypothetical protein